MVVVVVVLMMVVVLVLVVIGDKLKRVYCRNFDIF